MVESRKTLACNTGHLCFMGRLMCALIVSLCMSSCAIPHVLTPRIEASGVVLDQYDKPVTNAQVRVTWLPVTMFPAMPTGERLLLQTNTEGEWSLSMRGINQMSLRALPPKGYGYERGKDYTVEIVRHGRQTKTNCILRLEKE